MSPDSDVKQLLSRAISITYPMIAIAAVKVKNNSIIYLARTELHDSSHLLLIHLAVNLAESQLL